MGRWGPAHTARIRLAALGPQVRPQPPGGAAGLQPEEGLHGGRSARGRGQEGEGGPGPQTLALAGAPVPSASAAMSWSVAWCQVCASWCLSPCPVCRSVSLFSSLSLCLPVDLCVCSSLCLPVSCLSVSPSVSVSGSGSLLVLPFLVCGPSRGPLSWGFPGGVPLTPPPPPAACPVPVLPRG